MISGLYFFCMLFFRYGNSDNISPAAGGVSDETETDAKAVDQSAEYGDQIYIYKIDTEKEPELAAAFGIRSIPSLLFVPMNGTPQMAQGAMSKADFKRAIDQVLLNR